jgi:hypothetical protein
VAATLKVTAGPAQGQALEIEHEIAIGRENADLTIDDSELSRRHVAVRPVEGGVEVKDLGSLNGTFVDGRRIAEPVVVSRSARVKIGTSELEIEVALPEPMAPDVTAPRQIPADPDVTAPHRQAPAAAGPSPAAPPPPAKRPSPVGKVLGALLVLVAVVALVVLLAGAGGGTKKRRVDAVIANTSLEITGNKETVTGVLAGDPFGAGSTRFDETFPGSPADALSGPTDVSVTFTLLFDDGTITGTGRLRITGTTGRDASISGTLDFKDGTREFDGAKGSATMQGEIDGQAVPQRTQARLKGDIEY